MRALAVVAALVLSGCFGLGERTEWAYDVTGFAAVDGRTGAGVVVAVLDTGVNLAHPSLDHLSDGERANGEVIAFRDFYTNQEGVAHAIDDHGHGSHVTGIIAARGGTSELGKLVGGVDLLGGAPNVQLVIARVCKAERDGSSCNGAIIDEAVRWAVNRHGAQVLSLSLGEKGGVRDLVSEAIENDIEAAINDAIDRGVVTVVSAGNDGPTSDDVNSPADIPRVIAVGAIGKDLRVWSGSSRGDNGDCSLPLPSLPGGCRAYPNRKPELVAPGVDILSAWKGDAWFLATGTSQATPFVTSAVALMLEGKPRLTDAAGVAAVKQALVDTTDAVQGQDTPHDDAAGYGILRVDRAVKQYG